MSTPPQVLPRSTPSAEGVDAAGLLDLLDAAEAHDLGLHSLMVLRHGRVVAEGWWTPYAASRPHLGYSLSKSLTATAVGFLVGEVVLGLDDPVLDLLPPTPHAAGWGGVTVRHCLTMTVGHDVEAWDRVFPHDGDLLEKALGIPLDHEPGTHFAYNQVATYVLARALHHLTGAGPSEVLRPRLLEPLGLPVPPWHTDRQGHEIGFSGAHPVTETIAAVAQLHLDGGRWGERQLLDPAWVAEATRGFGPLNRDPGAGPDWRRGYGFSFWQQRHGYRGDGAFGQFLAVLPEHDVAVAITSENEDMQATLDALWTHVVPTVDRPGSPADDERLAARLAVAAIPPLGGERRSDVVAASPVPRGDGLDLAAAYDAVEVVGDRLRLRRLGTWHDLVVGDGRWTDGAIGALPVSVSGGWDGETFRAQVLVVETPHRIHVEVSGGEASLRWRRPPLHGTDPLALAVR